MLARPPTQIVSLPDGPGAVRETLKIMRAMVRSAKRDPFIIDTARSIVKGVSSHNFRGEVNAIFFYVRDKIRFTKDVNGVEMLQTPEQLLRSRQGDCDDKCTLLASLLESIGHPTGFKAVGFKPNTLTHVFAFTRMGSGWITLDPSMKVPPGWQPPHIVNSLEIFNS